ncbi:MAG: phosphate ABC transporter substrate-binding protein [Magnetococcales bacterium]|nr:phosphate ABC transporter substrate-binding protein [Magnetococcales bacterium]
MNGMKAPFALLLLPLLVLASGEAHADIAVIVHPGNPVSTLEPSHLSDLYLGRRRTFPDGKHATVLEQPRESALRRRFFQAVNGMSLIQVDTFWARLIFSGRVLPLHTPGDCARILSSVADTPDAIGYVDAALEKPGVKTVKLLPE